MDYPPILSSQATLPDVPSLNFHAIYFAVRIRDSLGAVPVWRRAGCCGDRRQLILVRWKVFMKEMDWYAPRSNIIWDGYDKGKFCLDAVQI